MTDVPKTTSIEWQQARQILNEAYRPSVSLRPIFAELMGDSLTVGMYLSRAHYWSDKGKDPDGWIYKTCDEFKAETFLSRRQQDKAREALRDKPWWSEKVARVGATPKNHYRIDRDLLDAEVIEFILKKNKDNLTDPDLPTAIESDLPTAIESDLPTAIEYTKTDSSKIIYKDQDAHEQKSEVPETLTLAAGDPLTCNSDPDPEPEATQKELDLPTLCHSESESGSGYGKGSGGCRITIDNTNTVIPKQPWGDSYNSRDANRARAKAQSNYDLGLKNKRWSDRADFKKFELYASEWVRSHPELVLGGKNVLSNPTGYLIALTGKIARCVVEDDPCLAIWKNWQLEKQAFSPEFVAPELAIVTSTTEESKNRIQKAMARFNAERAANQAAQEAEQKANQEKRWRSMSA